MHHALPVNLSCSFPLMPHHNTHQQPPPLLISQLIALVVLLLRYKITLLRYDLTQLNSTQMAELSQAESGAVITP